MHNDPFLLQRENAAELYLIRHGNAIPGPEEIIPSGIYDDLPLSQLGRRQADKLAQRLKTSHFDAAYSSPLRRCLETAAPLLSHLALEPTIVSDIKEISTTDKAHLPTFAEGSDLTELTRALQTRQLETVRIAASTGHWDDVTTDESSQTFRARVVQAFATIIQQNIGQRVLVFCHGGVINAYAADVLGLQKEFFFPTGNTSITIIRATATTRVLYVLNDIAHLYLYN